MMICLQSLSQRKPTFSLSSAPISSHQVALIPSFISNSHSYPTACIPLSLALINLHNLILRERSAPFPDFNGASLLASIQPNATVHIPDPGILVPVIQ